jgi:hypothetical protein
MEKLALTFIALAFANPNPAPPKTSKALPKVTTPLTAKPVELTAETKVAIELSKIKPLPHLEAVKVVKATIGAIETIDEANSFRLTPREPWHDGAFLNFVSANVVAGPPQPDMAPYAVIRGSTTWSSELYVSFPTSPGWAYMMICDVAGTSDFLLNRGGAGQEPVSAVGGHLTLGIPRQTVAARAKFHISAPRSFSMSGCEVIRAR